MFNNRKFLYIYFSGLVLLPIILIILPADFFDKGNTMCLSVLLADQECYGCGITRAIQHLIHFNFEKAYAFNKLSFVVLPLMIYVWYSEIKKTYIKLKNLKKDKLV